VSIGTTHDWSNEVACCSLYLTKKDGPYLNRKEKKRKEKKRKEKKRKEKKSEAEK
jgi:hypothetical protein